MLVTNNMSNEFLLGRGFVLTPFGVLLVPDDTYLHDDYVRRSVNALMGSGDGTVSDAPDWFPIEDAGGVKLTVNLNSLPGASGPPGAPGDQGPTGAPGPSGPGLYWIWRRKPADEPLALSTLLHDDDTLHFSSSIGDFWHPLVGPVGSIGCWSIHPQTV